jgi:hypothetical protein
MTIHNPDPKTVVPLEEATPFTVEITPDIGVDFLFDQWGIDLLDRRWLRMKMEGYTWNEIGEELGCSVNRLKRARRRLIRRLRGS